MRIITPPQIHEELLRLLDGAESAAIAVAYFNEVSALQERLAKLPRLRVVVSAEWHVSDPRPLRRLCRTTARQCRAIEVEDAGGRLHAKAYVVVRSDGRRTAIVGSANVSAGALSKNRELVCVLEDPSDGTHIDEVQRLVERWFAEGSAIDWKHAERIFDSRPPRKRGGSKGGEPHREDADDPAENAAIGSWIIKTSPGPNEPSYWPEFQREEVIAIGWERMKGDPASMTNEQISAAIVKAYGDDGRSSSKVAAFFRKFGDQDNVLILRGYQKDQARGVYIYGFASLAGPAAVDSPSQWWTFKRPAEITPVEAELPYDVVAKAIQLETCLETIHATDVAGLVRLLKAIEQESGSRVPWAPRAVLVINDSGGVHLNANPWLQGLKLPIDLVDERTGKRIELSRGDSAEMLVSTPSTYVVAKGHGHIGVLSDASTQTAVVRVVATGNWRRD